MSNSHYRKSSQDSSNAAQKSSRQQVIEQLETRARRRKLTEDAIFRLYLRRDGERIEAQLKAVDLGIAIATVCRQDELKRAQEQGVTQREKGERPFCSFSETRLFSTRQLQLMDRRAEILASCRAEVMEWLSRWDPNDDDALRVALDTCLGDFSEDTREAVERSADPLGSHFGADAKSAGATQTPKPNNAKSQPLTAADLEYLKKTDDLKAQLSPEDRAALDTAQKRNDTAALEEIVSRQPENWLREFSQATIDHLKAQEGK